MNALDRLTSLGFSLPQPPKPAGSYTRAVRTANLVFVAGQLPMVDGKIAFIGRVGADLSIEEGYRASQICALNALSILNCETDSLDSVRQIVRLTGYVRSETGFSEQPVVVNGASELMFNLFGKRGIHARLAVGVSELPLGAAVELEVIAEVE